MKFGFIGGTPRGFALFNALLENNYKPEFCVILKEDDHENLKVSGNFLEVSENQGILSSTKKKLVQSDYDLISKLDLDFIIVCGWRTLINPEINNYLKVGMIAAHDSLLPKYRGFAPLNWSIINGETETGVTLFIINDGETDSGDIICIEKVTIGKDEVAEEVYDKIINATNSCYLQMMQEYEVSGQLSLTKQDEALATYTCKRTPDDGRIDWNQSSESVYNLIRALVYPYSGAFFYHNDKKYEVRSASLGLQNHKQFSGRIAGRIIALQGGIEVLCGTGSVFIKDLFDESTNQIINSSEIFKSITIKLG